MLELNIQRVLFFLKLKDPLVSSVQPILGNFKILVKLRHLIVKLSLQIHISLSEFNQDRETLKPSSYIFLLVSSKISRVREVEGCDVISHLVALGLKLIFIWWSIEIYSFIARILVFHAFIFFVSIFEWRCLCVHKILAEVILSIHFEIMFDTSSMFLLPHFLVHKPLIQKFVKCTNNFVGCIWSLRLHERCMCEEIIVAVSFFGTWTAMQRFCLFINVLMTLLVRRYRCHVRVLLN